MPETREDTNGDEATAFFEHGRTHAEPQGRRRRAGLSRFSVERCPQDSHQCSAVWGLCCVRPESDLI